MDTANLRLECCKLAATLSISPSELTDVAGRIYEFVSANSLDGSQTLGVRLENPLTVNVIPAA